jgi:hypothetical protein
MHVEAQEGRQMLKEATVELERFEFEDEGIIELPSREAMTGLGLSLCISVDVKIGLGCGNPCYDPCRPLC